MFFGLLPLKKPKVLQVAVEYHAPHWLVLIRNPGQPDWRALRDPNRKINIQDEFGTVIRTRSAIQSFSSFDKANDWVAQNLPKASRVNERKPQEIRSFANSLEGSRHGSYPLEPNLAHANNY